MSRRENMSKMYPVTGYTSTEENVTAYIEKMESEMRKMKKADISDAEKATFIRAKYEAIVEMVFNYEVCYDRVVDYIDWLYENDDENAAALDLALKLFNTLKDLSYLSAANRRVLETACNRLEEIGYEADLDEEIFDDIMFCRVHNDF